MATCKHLNFVTEATISRITESGDDDTVVGYSADIKINCADCGQAFVFLGMPFGYSPVQPMCSPDRLEARLPLADQSDFLDTIMTMRQEAKA